MAFVLLFMVVIYRAFGLAANVALVMNLLLLVAFMSLLGATLTLILVVFSEFFCSVLIGIGLATRLAAIPLIITMLVAAFVTHGADPIGKKELALLYLISYGVLLVAGSGKYSVDHLLMRNKEGGA